MNSKCTFDDPRHGHRQDRGILSLRTLSLSFMLLSQLSVIAGIGLLHSLHELV